MLRKVAAATRAVDPLPLVPVIWIERKARWGSPTAAIRANIGSRLSPSTCPAVGSDGAGFWAVNRSERLPSRFVCSSRKASALRYSNGRPALGFGDCAGRRFTGNAW